MSRLETNDIATQIRPDTTQVGRLGITGSLQSPGVAPVANLGNQDEQTILGDILAATGNLAGSIGARARQERLEGEARSAAAKAENEKERRVRGIAARNQASAALIPLQSQIEKGEIGRRADETVGEAVNRIIFRQTDGMDDVTATAWIQTFRPGLTRSIQNFEDGFAAKSEQLLTETFAERAVRINPNRPDARGDIQNLLELGRSIPAFKDLPEAEFQFNILGPALEAAAKDGESGVAKIDMIDKIARALPQATVAEARNQAQVSALRLIELNERTRSREIFELATTGDPPNPLWEQRLAEAVEDGTIRPRKAIQVREDITGITEGQRRQRANLRFKETAISLNTERATVNPTETGGISSFQDAVLPDGSVYTKEQQTQDVIDRVVPQLLTDPNRSEAKKLTDAFEFLSSNGGQTYGPFSSQMVGAANLSLPALTKPEFPQTAVNGFALFKAMRATHPGLLRKHGVTENSPERRFLEDQRLFAMHQANGNQQVAAVAAKDPSSRCGEIRGKSTSR